MREEIIYSIPALYRGDFKVRGFYFGSGKKSLCIVGSTRGNEYQQIYIASLMVKQLKEWEADGILAEDTEILVIPCVNPSSMNIEKRFWATDNTDINRMFPGYNLGETTQRIADGVFKAASEYENGIQFTSFYMPGRFCPHVRMMKTDMENVDKARQFGLPYIVLKTPVPYDTTTLNYNWQIWETDAYSLYSATTSTIDEKSADLIIKSIRNFMAANGMLKLPFSLTEDAYVFNNRQFTSIRPDTSGIFRTFTEVGKKVKKDELLAQVLDPYTSEIIESLYAPKEGVIFFLHDKPLVYAKTAVIKLL